MSDPNWRLTHPPGAPVFEIQVLVHVSRMNSEQDQAWKSIHSSLSATPYQWPTYEEARRAMKGLYPDSIEGVDVQVVEVK